MVRLNSTSQFYQRTQPDDFIDRKEKMIRASQQNKEESIKRSSSARSATDTMVAFYPEIAGIQDGQEKARKIREVWEAWQSYYFDKLDSPF